MRLREMAQLNEAMLLAAAKEVMASIEKGPGGGDSIVICGPDNPIAKLFAAVDEITAKRRAQYGPETGPQVARHHGLHFAFRIGAAYGRRVPDLTEPDLETPMSAKERAASIAAILGRACPREVLREICLELALLVRQEETA